MTQPSPSVRGYARWLAFTMYIGAANFDATVEQREELQKRLRPLLLHLREDNAVAAVILQEVTRVMGPEWRPTGQWAIYLEKLIGEN